MHLIAAIVSLVLLVEHVEAGYNCPKDLHLSDDMRSTFLNAHNSVRRNVAIGKQPNKVGFLGPAKNMYEMRWDCDFERKAQKAISGCTMKEETGKPENIIEFNGGDSIDDNIFVTLAMTSWVDQVTYFGLSNATTAYQGKCCQFANMVHSKTTKIGCAYKRCNNKFIVMCVYDKCGNVYGTNMWEKGKPCKKNEDCTTYSGSTCSNSLCVAGGSSDDSGSTVAPKPIVPSEVSCSNNEMTNEARQKVLQLHNEYRSLVAKGQAKDKIGGYAPKASKMLKMIYDCKIEANAIKVAKKCVFKHSDKDTERPGLGENLYMTSALKYDKTAAVQQASQGWFSELAKYGVGPENRLTEELWNRPNMMIGHYTQMVWQRSYKLGCAVEWCPSMTLLVCQYGPAGNMQNGLIYEKGNPCTKDADCGGNNKCSRDEALCIVQ